MAFLSILAFFLMVYLKALTQEAVVGPVNLEQRLMASFESADVSDGDSNSNDDDSDDDNKCDDDDCDGRKYKDGSCVLGKIAVL